MRDLDDPTYLQNLLDGLRATQNPTTAAESAEAFAGLPETTLERGLNYKDLMEQAELKNKLASTPLEQAPGGNPGQLPAPTQAEAGFSMKEGPQGGLPAVRRTAPVQQVLEAAETAPKPQLKLEAQPGGVPIYRGAAAEAAGEAASKSAAEAVQPTMSAAFRRIGGPVAEAVEGVAAETAAVAPRLSGTLGRLYQKYGPELMEVLADNPALHHAYQMVGRHHPGIIPALAVELGEAGQKHWEAGKMDRDLAAHPERGFVPLPGKTLASQEPSDPKLHKAWETAMAERKEPSQFESDAAEAKRQREAKDKNASKVAADLSTDEGLRNFVKFQESPGGVPILTPYKDANGWAIGHGEGISSPSLNKIDKITPEQAEQLLDRSLAKAGKTVDSLVSAELAPAQRNALTSFVYNVGSGNFKNSTLLKKLNGGDMEGAAAEFDKWNKMHEGDEVKESKALTARRAAERQAFESAIGKNTPPSIREDLGTFLASQGGESRTPANDLGGVQDNGLMQAFASGQLGANNAKLVNDIGRAASMFGASVARVQPHDLDVFDKQGKSAQESADNFAKNFERQKFDPTSNASQLARKVAAKLGIKSDLSAFSASDLEKFLPTLKSLAVAEMAESQKAATASAADERFHENLDQRKKTADNTQVSRLRTQLNTVNKNPLAALDAVNNMEHQLDAIESGKLMFNAKTVNTIGLEYAKATNPNTGLTAAEREKYNLADTEQLIKDKLSRFTGEEYDSTRHASMMKQLRAKIQILREAAIASLEKRTKGISELVTNPEHQALINNYLQKHTGKTYSADSSSESSAALEPPQDYVDALAKAEKLTPEQARTVALKHPEHWSK